MEGSHSQYSPLAFIAFLGNQLGGWCGGDGVAVADHKTV